MPVKNVEISSLTKEQKELYQNLLSEKSRRACEKRYYEFFKTSWEILDPATPYIDNWHYELICDTLQEMIERCARREKKQYDLIINQIPRSGKTLMISVMLPAWTWINFPQLRFIATSYALPLSLESAVKSRRLMTSEWFYNYWSNNFRLTSDQNVKHYFENNHGGYRISTSVGATLLGQGANIFIIDDPLEATKADSETYRKECIDWFRGTAYSRLNNQNCDIRILMMQRLHENDLTGYILEELKTGWRHICIPAELRENTSPELRQFYKDGLFFPERFGVDVLADLKKTYGPYGYSGQVLQSPFPEEGGYFKKSYWKFYKKTTLPTYFDEKIQAWDMTFKDGREKEKIDYVVGQVWGRTGVEKYLLDQIRLKLDFTQTLDAVRDMASRYPECSAIYIEGKANGSAAKSVLKKEFPNVIEDNEKTSDSKLSKALPFVRQAQAGNIFIPDPSEAPWVNDYIMEHAAFPRGRYDDQCDSSALGVRKLSYTEKIFPSYGADNYGEFPEIKGEPFTVFSLMRSGQVAGVVFKWHPMEELLYVVKEIHGEQDYPKAEGSIWTNDKLFREGHNVSFYLRKKGLQIRHNDAYEEMGAIYYTNQLIGKKKLKVDAGCREIDRFLKNWSLKNGVPDPAGMGIVECLLIVVSVLKVKIEKAANKPEKRPYGRPSSKAMMGGVFGMVAPITPGQKNRSGPQSWMI